MMKKDWRRKADGGLRAMRSSYPRGRDGKDHSPSCRSSGRGPALDHPMGDMMMKAVMPLADMGCVGGSDKGERAHDHDVASPVHQRWHPLG